MRLIHLAASRHYCLGDLGRSGADTYFHVSQEDRAKRIAGDRYELCIKQAWATKGGVERCNKELRQALAIAR